MHHVNRSLCSPIKSGNINANGIDIFIVVVIVATKSANRIIIAKGIINITNSTPAFPSP